MKLKVTINSKEHLDYCLANNIEAIIIGNDFLSLRNTISFDLNEIAEINQNSKNTEVYVLVNKIFVEDELEELAEYLIKLSKIKIDKIIFQDFAIIYLIEKHNLSFYLNYNPETLVTSHYQFDFYQKCNIKEVSLAKELTFYETDEIIKNKKNLTIEILGHGYVFIMHSRWNLISNFEKYYQTTLNRKIWIREEMRQLSNLMYEDRNGSHMFSGYELATINLLDKFNNLDYLKIDTFFYNSEKSIAVTKLYQEAFFKMKHEEYDLDFKNRSFDKLNELADKFVDNGFLKNNMKHPHLKKYEQNNK